MPYLRLLLICTLFILAACEPSSSDAPKNEAPAATPEVIQPEPKKTPLDTAALAKRYASQALNVLDISEIQLDGASTLSVTFSVPLGPEQKLAERLHLVDSKSGTVDGAWELSDNLMTVYLRHLEPKRELIFTADASLKGIAGQSLNQEYSAKLETQDIKPIIGFASRGSLLPTRLAEGLPVITLNVDKVNVEFFRVKPEGLPKFLAEWGNSSSLDSWSTRKLMPLADLVYGGRFELNPKRNTRENLLLPISAIKPLQEPGVYLAVMREAGDYSRYSTPATVFSLSDIGLSAHRYQGQLAVLTQALDGGEPLAAIELELLSRDGQLLQSGKTDKAGYALLPLVDKADVLLARQGNQSSILPLKRAALDLSEFKVDGQNAHSLQLFVFGPRDLYRPGETALLNALLRDADGKPVSAQPINLEVKKPDGQTARTLVLNSSEDGFYQYALPIAADAPTGRWQLIFDLGSRTQSIVELMVEDFLPERLALSLSASKQPLSTKDSAKIEVEGRYLYGAPAAGNRLSGQAFLRPLREAVSALPGYQFGNITEKNSQDFDLDEQALNAEGKALISIPSDWENARSPLTLMVQASLQESGGRPITRRVVQPIWPAEQLPGLRPLFDGKEIDEDSLAEFELVMADSQGNKLAAENLKVRWIYERRDYYWRYSEQSGWGYDYNEKPIQLSEQSVQIAEGNTSKISFPVEWGSYRVEVEDPKTGVISSARFWAGYRWQDNRDGAVRPDQVKLALDKPAYQAGDIAKVTITPPAAGRGWLLLESSEGPLWWQAIDIPEGGKTLELPVSADWARHDLYLSALVIRPGE